MDALDGTAGGLVGNRAADVAGQREGGVDAPRVAALAERDHAADPERALAVVPLAHVLALAAVDEQHLVPTRGQEGHAIGSVGRIHSTEFLESSRVGVVGDHAHVRERRSRRSVGDGTADAGVPERLTGNGPADDGK